MNKKNSALTFTRLAACSFLLALVVACGGGGGSAGPAGTAENADTRRFDGQITKAALQQAGVTVQLLNANGSPQGALINAGETDSEGRFSAVLPTDAGVVRVRTAGGFYFDEADPEPNGELRRSIALDVDSGFDVVFPGDVDEMVLTLVTQLVSDKSRVESGDINLDRDQFNPSLDSLLATNRQAVVDAVGFDVFAVQPADPVNPAAGATANELQYAMLVGGLAQILNKIATDNGAGAPTAVHLQALRLDLSDGRIDGSKNGDPVLIDGEPLLNNVDLNSEIRRFRNNNAASYGSVELLRVDEDALGRTNERPNTVPVAAADSVVVQRGGTSSLASPGVLANDTDNDGDGIIATLVSPASQGTVTVDSDGSVFYEHGGGRVAEDSFSYRVTDANGDTDEATVTVTVEGILPLAEPLPDSANTERDVSINIDVLANDSGNIDVASLQITSSASNGTAEFDSGSVFYTPNTGFVGTDSFNYRVANNQGDFSDPVAVTITVQPPSAGDPPVANNASVELNEDQNGSADISGTDPDGDLQQFEIISLPIDVQAFSDSAFINPLEIGQTLPASDGQTTIYLQPSADFSGQESLAFRAVDSFGSLSNTAVLSIGVVPVNDAPVAVNDAFQTNENTALVLSAANGLLANDSDPEGDDLQLVAINGDDTAVANTVTLPSGALLTVQANGAINYDPNGAFDAAVDGQVDNFSYTVSDGGLSATANVQITITPVNDAPVAVDDTGATDEDTALQVAAADGVLANDSDIEGDNLTVTRANGQLIEGQIDLPSGALLTISANGSYRYDPNGQFEAITANAIDSFSYTVSDGELSSTANVEITISPVNDAPVAVADTGATDEDTALQVAAAEGVLANDSDIEGDNLTVTRANGQLIEGQINLPSGALLTISANGSYRYDPNGQFEAITADAIDSFSYTVSDGELSSTANVEITISPVNDAPLAVEDTGSTDEDTALDVGAADGLLANDVDPDSANLVVAFVEGQSVGGPTSGPIGLSSGALVTVQSDGSYIYEPDGAFDSITDFTEDSFSYTVSDGSLSSTATVTITVLPVNDAPFAVDDSGTTDEDSVLIQDASVGLLANDSDIEGDELTVAEVNGDSAGVGAEVVLASGALLIVQQDGSYSYDPNGQFDAITANATDSFVYTVSDGDQMASANVSITITPVNDPPVAVDDFYTNGFPGTRITVDPNRDIQPAWDPRQGSELIIFRTGRSPGNATVNNLGQSSADGSIAEGNLVVGPTSGFGISSGEPSFVGSAGLAVLNRAQGAHSYLEVNVDSGAQIRNVLAIPGGSGGGWMAVSRDGSTAMWRISQSGGGGLTELRVAPYSTLNGQSANAVGTVVVSVNLGSIQEFTEAAALTPDGSAFVLSEQSGSGRDLFLRSSTDGSLIRQLTTSGADSGVANRVPDISPDGQVVVFASNPTEPASDIYTINLDGTGLTQVTDTGDASEYDPSFSPDGNRLAIRRNDTLDNGGHDGSIADNNNIYVITIGAAIASGGSAIEGSLLEENAPGVLGNDFDVEGDNISAVLISQPANAASFQLNPDGSFSYEHDGGETTSDSFTYRVRDSASAESAPAMVTIDIAPQNDAPQAIEDSASVDEDSSTMIDVSANDTDAEDEVPGGSVTITTAPANGTAIVESDQLVTYTPNADFNGADSFEYRVTDSQGLASNQALVSITVNALNDAPVAVDDAGSTNEDTVLTLNAAMGLLNNDSDIDGDDLSVTEVNGNAAAVGDEITLASGALLTVQADGGYSFNPNGQFEAGGEATFSYTVSDGLLTANANVTITVSSENDVPIAVDDTGSTNEDSVLSVSAVNGVLSNDSDIEGATLTVVAVNGDDRAINTTITLASGALLTLQGDGSYDYNPNGAFEAITANATDSFSYTISDGELTASALVTITIAPVNDAPVAVNDAGSTDEDSLLSVNAADGLLANDSDAEGNNLTVVEAQGQEPGTPISLSSGAVVTVQSDGSYLYDPNGAFEFIAVNAEDSFGYTVSDGALTSTATVTITVTPVNDGPVAADDSYTATEDQVFDTPTVQDGLLGNDSDIDSNNLTITAVNEQSAAVGSEITLPSGALLTVQFNGSFRYRTNGAFEAITENTADSFTYTVSDGELTATATATMTITPVNDAPVANNDSYSTSERNVLTVAAAGVLGNDTDVDSANLQVSAVNGQAADVGQSLTLASGALLTLNADGSLSYNPNGQFDTITTDALENFAYTVSDGTLTANASVEITIVRVNDTPTIQDVSNNVDEDTTLPITLTGADIDGTIESFNIVVLPDNGVLSLDSSGTPPISSTPTTLSAGGTETVDLFFIPDPDFNGSGTTNRFRYEATDNDGRTSDDRRYAITVNSVNDAPTAADDTAATDEDSPVTFSDANGLLANDIDIDSQINVVQAAGEAVPTNTLVTIDLPSGARITMSRRGGYTYDPNGAFEGITTDATDSFEYVISDGEFNASATVTVTITPVNDAPVAVNDSGATDEDTVLSVNAMTGLLANDSDIEGDSLAVATVDGNAASVGSQITLSSGALLTVQADGSYEYDPNGAFEAVTNGAIDSFNYDVTDGNLSATATVTINIESVNDAPVVVDDTATTNEDSVVTFTAANGVLSNDSDVDSNFFLISAAGENVPDNVDRDIDLPSGAILIINREGAYSYNPNGAFEAITANTTDSFDYTVTDNGFNVTGTVTITITPVNDAPVAVNDIDSTDEDTGITRSAASGVLTNDSDIENDPITVSAVEGDLANVGQTITLASGALLTLQADGGYIYEPNGQFESITSNATDVFTYAVSDGQLSSNASVTVTITPVNDAPTAVDDTGTTDEDTVLMVNAGAGLLANDSDAEGSQLFLNALEGQLLSGDVQVTLASGAVVTARDDGSYDYDPSGAFEAITANTTDSFTYEVSDGDLTATATVVITITPVNDSPQLPMGFEAAFTVIEGRTVTVTTDNIDAEDAETSDPALLSFSVSDATLAVGQFELQGGSGPVTGFTLQDIQQNRLLFVHTQSPATTSIDDVAMSVSDPDGGSAMFNLRITVTPESPFRLQSVNAAGENDAEIYSSRHRLARAGDNLVFSFTNDIPMGSGDTEATLVVKDVNSNSSQRLTVGPAAAGDSAIGQVDISDAAGLVAFDSEASDVVPGVVTNLGVQQIFGYRPGTGETLLISDARDGTTTEPTPLTQGSARSASVSAGGDRVAFASNSNDLGAAGESQIYVWTNGVPDTQSPLQTVSVSSDGVQGNDDSFKPDISANGRYVVFESRASNLSNADTSITSDIFRHDLVTGTTIRVSLPDGVLDEGSPVVVNGQSREPTVSASGRRVAFASASDDLVAGDSNGLPDLFVKDLVTGAVLRINIDAGERVAVQVASSSRISADGRYVVFTSGTDTMNQTNPNAGADVWVVQLPGTLTGGDFSGSIDRLMENGSGLINGLATDPDISADGSLISLTSNGTNVSPDDDEANRDVFTIANPLATVNGSPVANDDSGTTDEDTALNVSPATGLLANDSDPDGDALSIVAVNGVTANVGQTITLASGALLTVGALGDYSYDPNGQFEAPVGDSLDSFEYTVSDGSAIADAAVTIMITSVNDAPVAVNDTGTTDEDTPLVRGSGSGLLANDTDPEGDMLRVVRLNDTAIDPDFGNTIMLPSGARVGITQNGLFTYEPSGAFESITANVTDSFSYEITDTSGASATAVFNVTITPVNDPPVVNNAAATVVEGNAITLNEMTVNVSDVDNDLADLNYTVRTPLAANGTLQLQGMTLNGGDTFTQLDLQNGLIAYVHDGSETTSDSVLLTVADSTDSTDFTLAITVTPVNDSPAVTAAGPIAVAAGESLLIDTSILNAVDPETTDPADLLFTANNSEVGEFFLNDGVSTPAAVTSFTLNDVQQGFVSFNHTEQPAVTESELLPMRVFDADEASTFFNIQITVALPSPFTLQSLGGEAAPGVTASIFRQPVMVGNGENILFIEENSDGQGNFTSTIVLKEIDSTARVDLPIGPVTNQQIVIVVDASHRAELIVFDADGGEVVPGLAVPQGRRQVYGYRPASDEFILISDTSDGTAGPTPVENDARNPYVSADGRTVVFESVSMNFQGANGRTQIYAWHADTPAGQPPVKLVTRNINGNAPNADSGRASVSADGRFIAFVSDASDLVAGDTNNSSDIFVYDTLEDRMRRASLPDGLLDDDSGPGGPTPANDDSFDVQISNDGRRVVFSSRANNLVAGDSGSTLDYFAKDMVTGATLRVNFADGQRLAEFNVNSPAVTISGDGRYVTFSSRTDTDGHSNPNNARDIWVAELPAVLPSNDFSGNIDRLFETGGGNSNGDSILPSLSANGAVIGLQSSASNLSVDDTDAAQDIFSALNTLFTANSMLDSDGDTLTDQSEDAVHLTSPFRSDSDFDLLSDADEIAINMAAGSPVIDPNNPDSDGDDVGDGLEQLLGTSPFVAASRVLHVSAASQAITTTGLEWNTAFRNNDTLQQSPNFVSGDSPQDSTYVLYDEGTYSELNLSNMDNMIFVGGLSPTTVVPGKLDTTFTSDIETAANIFSSSGIQLHSLRLADVTGGTSMSGGLSVNNSMGINIHRSEIVDNEGVGLISSSSAVNLFDTLVAANNNQNGFGAAGVEIDFGGTVTATRSRIVGNVGNSEAGGVRLGAGDSFQMGDENLFIATDSVIAHNLSFGPGGGIRANDESNVTVTNSVLLGNIAGFDDGQGGGFGQKSGGAVYRETSDSEDGSLKVENSTLAYNEAQEQGGGFANVLLGSIGPINVQVSDTTLWFNLGNGGMQANELDQYQNDGDTTGTVFNNIQNVGASLPVSNFDMDPLFEEGLRLQVGDLGLDIPASPNIDAGSQSASASPVVGQSTEVKGGPDTGTVDIGAHFRRTPLVANNFEATSDVLMPEPNGEILLNFTLRNRNFFGLAKGLAAERVVAAEITAHTLSNPVILGITDVRPLPSRPAAILAVGKGNGRYQLRLLDFPGGTGTVDIRIETDAGEVFTHTYNVDFMAL